MKIKLTLATATAIGLMMASAQANDANTLYLEQIGGANQASVNQSVANGGNDIGTAADPVTQKGDRNDFRFSNASNNYGGNNDITKAEQFGDDNYFSNSVWNGAGNNVIRDFEQKGDANRARAA